MTEENNNEEMNEEMNEEQLEAAKQEIRDGINTPKDDGEKVELPSDEIEEEDKTYAKVFKSVGELKKGIDNLGSTLPDYVLDGMTDEALERHYSELRSDYDSEDKVNERKHAEKKDEAEDKPSENISDKLWSELDVEFNTNGTITDEQYNQLNKAGIPDAVIDKYLDGLNAETEKFTQDVYAVAGGKEQYEEIKAWAEENFTQKELNAVASGSHTDMLLKMKGIKADYMSQTNNGQDRFRGSQGGSSNGGYRSQQDYIMDRMSPDYKKSAKFRAKVESKFKASSFA